MGIQGLEHYIDYNFYKNDSADDQVSVFEKTPLKQLRLLIEGDQFIHAYFDYHKSGVFGGDYDTIYEQLKTIVSKLAPYVEIFVFEGCKAHSNELQKLHKNISRYNGVNSAKKIDGFRFTARKPFFVRHILQRILNELNIKFAISNNSQPINEPKKLSEARFEHQIAVFANNLHGEKDSMLTILSKNSYFYINKLEKGYITWKCVTDLIMSANFDANTPLPVFNYKKLCKSLGMKWQSFFYFCILSGENDGILKRRDDFVNAKRGPKDKRAFHKVLRDYLKREEFCLSRNNYEEIRSQYTEDVLDGIDEIRNMLELKQAGEKAKLEIESGQTCIEFDRFKKNLNFKRACYFKLVVEDFEEENCYSIVQNFDLLKLIYSAFNRELTSVTEFYRVKSASDVDLNNNNNNNIVENLVNLTDFSAKQNPVLNYLDKKRKTCDRDDLFFVSLSMWNKWLSENFYENEIEVKPNEFVDSLLLNFLILSLKRDNSKDEESIVKLYDRLKSARANLEDFCKSDVRLVHRLNEFQAVYFAIGVLNQMADLGFELLSVAEFLNGCFLVKCLKKETNDDLETLNELLAKSEKVQQKKRDLLDKFKTVSEEMFQTETLMEKLNNLKI